jgi:hypothetical protein
MKKLVLPIFGILILAQWIVPGKAIWEKELILRNGKVYKFLTEPVDPSHPFKGRYITLDFKSDTFKVNYDPGFTYEDQVFLILGTDKEGFAKINGISKVKPPEGNDYLLSSIEYIDLGAGGDDEVKTYASVRIWKGDAVMQDVMINDTSIRNIIDSQSKSK